MSQTAINMHFTSCKRLRTTLDALTTFIEKKTFYPKKMRNFAAEICPLGMRGGGIVFVCHWYSVHYVQLFVMVSPWPPHSKMWCPQRTRFSQLVYAEGKRYPLVPHANP